MSPLGRYCNGSLAVTPPTRDSSTEPSCCWERRLLYPDQPGRLRTRPSPASGSRRGAERVLMVAMKFRPGRTRNWTKNKQISMNKHPSLFRRCFLHCSISHDMEIWPTTSTNIDVNKVIPSEMLSSGEVYRNAYCDDSRFRKLICHTHLRSEV